MNPVFKLQIQIEFVDLNSTQTELRDILSTSLKENQLFPLSHFQVARDGLLMMRLLHFKD